MTEKHTSLTRLFEHRFSPAGRSPDKGHLESVVTCFSNIPYENLTKIIRASVVKDPVKRLRQPFEVIRDYLDWGSGGTCFSLTNCLHCLLEEYGYNSRFRMANLGSRQNNHCALVVYLDDRPYLVDPGYLVTRPLPIPESGCIVHETRLNPVLLERDRIKNGLNFSTIEPEGVQFRYYLHGGDCSSDTFEMFWKDSFTWNMMHSLLITRVIPDGRFYLHDRHARWFNRAGRKSIKLKDHFNEVVTENTGIDGSIIVRAREILSETRSSFRRGKSGDGKTHATRTG